MTDGTGPFPFKPLPAVNPPLEPGGRMTPSGNGSLSLSWGFTPSSEVSHGVVVAYGEVG